MACGGPQGSGLGSVLFNVVINELEEGRSSKLMIFTDSGKLTAFAKARSERHNTKERRKLR